MSFFVLFEVFRRWRRWFAVNVGRSWWGPCRRTWVWLSANNLLQAEKNERKSPWLSRSQDLKGVIYSYPAVRHWNIRNIYSVLSRAFTSLWNCWNSLHRSFFPLFRWINKSLQDAKKGKLKFPDFILAPSSKSHGSNCSLLFTPVQFAWYELVMKCIWQFRKTWRQMR